MAHMAVSDIKRRTFYYEERLNRDGWDAFCSTQKMKMRNGNWSLEQYENERMELEATIQEEIALSLNLHPANPMSSLVKMGYLQRAPTPPPAVGISPILALRLRGRCG